MHTAIFLVSNIHCPSCVSYIQDTLDNGVGIATPAEVSLIDHTVRVQYDPALTNSASVTHLLLEAAFDVKHVTELDARHLQLQDREINVTSSAPRRSLWDRSVPRAKQKHIDNCLACQRERARKISKSKPWSRIRPLKRTISRTALKSASDLPGATATDTHSRPDAPAIINVDGADSEDFQDRSYVATMAIGGMTCSSCSAAITKELQSLPYVKSVEVNLVGNSARVIYLGRKDSISSIASAIEDIGYEATVDDVKEQTPANPTSFKAKLSIKGMTCGSCVGTITEGLKQLSQVSFANVDLISNSAVVEFHGDPTAQILLDKIDDLGYDGEVVEVVPLDSASASSAERTVQIKIDGMYCHHCSAKVVEAINQLHENETEKPAFQITQTPTLQDPIVTITYKSALANGISLRHFIKSIDAADEAFKASVYHPPSLEERSRRLQRKERRLILLRLLFTATVAVPTFIIGVVFMSLVSSTNPTRLWLETPIWSGMAMRMDWALFIMSTLVMIFGTDLFHRRALKDIWTMWRPKSKTPLLRRFYRFGSMNLLISAGTAVAYFSSLAVLILDATTKMDQQQSTHQSSDTYFDAVVFLTFFILIGRYLEAYSKAKTGDAVAMLSNLRPTQARLVDNGTVDSIPVDQLEIGDIVQIPRGQSPPTDGIVTQNGAFLFDESSLTGESRPVKKVFGDQVFTGSVNVSDAVQIKVTDLGGSSMLDQIINVVRQGQAKRAPIERFADILTGYFVPVITLLAITTWLIWLGLGVSGKLPSTWLDVRRGGWPFWSLEFAIAVFVVACPCGIGLAAPTALFVGGGLAAKNGILVQGGGEAFQEASQLTTIVFDKTGTLTQGQMKVTELERISEEWDDLTVKSMAKALEDASSHPIAEAVADYCSQTSPSHDPQDIQEISGMGMTGKFLIGETQYQAAVGNERLLTFLNNTSGFEKNSSSAETQENYYLTSLLQKHQSLGHSTAILAVRPLRENQSPNNNKFKPIALFAISDPIRPEAPSILSSLRSSGLDIHMCTGDNPTTAHAIASQLDIPVSNVRAGVLPQDKATYLNELQHPSGSAKRRIVAFVGDGTNDTPALSAADVSIALSSGSDIAMTTASFILLNPDLNTILTLVSLSKRVFRRVKLNFGWAGIYNVLLIPVAAGVFFAIGANSHHGGWRLGPVWSSCAMAASSVSVVLSSLALRLPEIKTGKIRRGLERIWPRSRGQQ